MNTFMKSNKLLFILLIGKGKLDFDEFCRVASHFNEEDDEALQKELKEAFRLYDKEGRKCQCHEFSIFLSIYTHQLY